MGFLSWFGCSSWPDVEWIEGHETIGGVGCEGVTAVALVGSHLPNIYFRIFREVSDFTWFDYAQFHRKSLLAPYKKHRRSIVRLDSIPIHPIPLIVFKPFYGNLNQRKPMNIDEYQQQVVVYNQWKPMKTNYNQWKPMTAKWKPMKTSESCPSYS